MHLREPTAHLVLRLVDPDFQLTRGGGVQLRKARIETRVLRKEVISPYIGFENGVECRGIVADDLHSKYSKICRPMIGLISYLLFDEEDRDVRGDRDLPHGNVSEKRRLSDTISADDAIAPAVCEREGCSRAFRKSQ